MHGTQHEIHDAPLPSPRRDNTKEFRALTLSAAPPLLRPGSYDTSGEPLAPASRPWLSGDAAYPRGACRERCCEPNHRAIAGAWKVRT